MFSGFFSSYISWRTGSTGGSTFYVNRELRKEWRGDYSYLEIEDHHEDVGVAGERPTTRVSNIADLGEQFDHVSEDMTFSIQV